MYLRANTPQRQLTHREEFFLSSLAHIAAMAIFNFGLDRLAKQRDKGDRAGQGNRMKEFSWVPDDPLYIYELEGILSDPEGFFRENFLAHWREGDSHFLFFSHPQEEDLQKFLKSQVRGHLGSDP